PEFYPLSLHDALPIFKAYVDAQISPSSGDAKAWVSYSTITTTTILSSFGISSLSDNGTGDTTINFSTSFSSANYAFTACSGRGADRKSTRLNSSHVKI